MVISFIDAIILAALAAGAWWGFRRGLVRQVSAIVGLVLGIAACIAVGDYATELLRALNPGWHTWPAPEQSTQVVALTLLFLLVFLTAVVAGFFVKGLTRLLLLGLIDRLAGAVLGASLLLLLLSLALNLWAVGSPGTQALSTERQEADHPLRMAMQAAPWALGMQPDSTGHNVGTN